MMAVFDKGADARRDGHVIKIDVEVA
jgi:hypothetical protein